MPDLLLDTQALIWWDDNDPRLGGHARAQIQDAGRVFVSSASGWEIVIKHTLGKLATRRPVARAVADGGFEELPITFEHAEAVAELPMHHRDPFDRLIIAVGRVEDLPVVTSDRHFASYDVQLVDAQS